MKNRLIITVSDVKSTKSYNIHQLVRKFIFFAIVAAILIIGGSFWLISFLSDQLTELKIEKEKEIRLLSEKEEKLIAQNKIYSMQIKDKVKDIDELSSKLDDIEEIIGLKHDDTADPIARATLAKITGAQKSFMLQTIPSGSPLEYTKVTSKFGYRIHPVSKKKKFHRGIDLKAKRRTKVYATADGVVNFVENKNRGTFGRVVQISHNFGFETVYAHLRKTNVKSGDIVRKGDLIGLSGNSGRSSGPHLHYEVRFARKVLDPKYFIKWNMKSYESIFEKQRRVKWESLVNLINDQKKNQVLQ